MFTISGRTASESPQPDSPAKKSIPQFTESVNPVPVSRRSTFAKRMSRTDGAMPANRGARKPFPAMVPVTWVPWCRASTQRSASFTDGSNQTRFVPHTLARCSPMSGWLMFSPVSITPIGTEAPPLP